jgi:hypothetical protein
VREGLPQFSHPISHRTPHYRMGKDGIVLLIAIKKRPIFRTQCYCKIQDEIDGNSLGNRRLSYRRGEVWDSRIAEIAISEALMASSIQREWRQAFCSQSGSQSGCGSQWSTFHSSGEGSKQGPSHTRRLDLKQMSR